MAQGECGRGCSKCRGALHDVDRRVCLYLAVAVGSSRRDGDEDECFNSLYGSRGPCLGAGCVGS